MTIRRSKPRRKAGVLSRYGWPIVAALYGVGVTGGLTTAVVVDQQAPVPVAAIVRPVVAPVVVPVEPPAPVEIAPAPAPAPQAFPPTPSVPTERRGGIKPITGEIAGIVEDEALAAGLDPVLMRVIAAIESGGSCMATTGSYHGLFQMSDREFRRRGGQGSVFGCRENARVAMQMFLEAATNFKFIHGREPTPTELYLVHQQGIAGISEHLKCPSCPAWQSMYRTAEYQRRGAKMARLAIWGNVPADVRAQFGSVDNITSAQFVEVWRRKVEGDGAAAVASATVPVPKPRPAVVPAPKIRAAYVVPCLVLEGPGCSGAPILLPR